MIDVRELIDTVADILRSAPTLHALAPHWGADPPYGHVFTTAPPVAAANVGRVPYIILAAGDGDQQARRQGDRSDALTTATLHLTCVDREDVGTLACRAAYVLVADEHRHLGDPEHVLGVALERGPVQALGPVEQTCLRLHLRLLTQPGA
jgi:hypothetical protein